MSDVKYHEAHVTVAGDIDTIEVIAKDHGFHWARLNKAGLVSTILTATEKGTDCGEIKARICLLVHALRSAGIHVSRYKLEAIVVDSNKEDSMNLLGDRA